MKRRAPVPFALALLLGFGVSFDVLPATTNLPAVADTALRSSVPDNNFGAVTPLPVGVGTFGSPVNRCLFKFDVTVLPTNAVITSVTLRLFLSSDPTLPASFDVNRLLQDWGEGRGTNAPASHDGSPALPGEATWNSRFYPSTPWGAGGGEAGTDFAATPSATSSMSGVTNDFTSAGLAADVQLWLQDPGTNFGWIVLATGEPASTGKLVGSREDPILAPIVIVDYSLPGTVAPAPPVIFGAALSGSQIRFSFNVESNRTYAVEFRDSLVDGSWSVLTNIAAQPADTTIDITNPISSPARFFRARTP